MKVIQYILKILFKSRWWLLGISFAAAIVVYVFMSMQPKIYKSGTTIYTGIVSGYDVLSSSSGNQDWMAVNNAIDNLISIVKAESTLENVFLRLLARNLINLDLNKDNEYQTVASSRALAEAISPEIFDLVVVDSEDETYYNLRDFYDSDLTNSLQQMFHWNDRHYSYKALSTVEVGRIGNSDMISISYQNDDQYIVFNTLKLVVEEFIEQYVALRYEQTNDVVGYFESELRVIRAELDDKENKLTSYNTTNQIINYEEQTKQVVERSKGIDVAIEEVSRKLIGAENHRKLLEEKMGIVTELYKNNADFIGKIHDISSLYSQDSKAVDAEEKGRLSGMINAETANLRNITGNISATKHTKEGLSAESMVSDWLNALLDEAKAKAELEVLKQSKATTTKEVVRYSPVGSSLKRQNRDINFSEQNYLSNLQALNEARLRQKNLQLTSATFKTLTPPTIAVTPESSKAKLFTLIAFILAFMLLAIIEIIAELLNQKPYDRIAAEKILKLPVLGAMPMNKNREYDDTCEEFALNQLGNSVLNFFDRTKSNNIINIISLDKEEGKSYIAEGLRNYFEKLDTKPAVVSWNKDFDASSKYYLMSSSIYDFAINEDNAELISEAAAIIVEYPPVRNVPFPTKLLSSAAINIVIVDAERSINGIDHILLRQLREYDKKQNLYVILNGADKDSVGLFTGILPPYTTRHKIRFSMWNLGSTDASFNKG